MNKTNSISHLYLLRVALVIMSATPIIVSQTQPIAPIFPQGNPVTVEQAIQLALSQASAFKQSELTEQIAAEDLLQSKAAFLPRLSANPTVIYTSPTLGSVAPGTPRQPSFLGANAITEYQGVFSASGELDLSGRLRANRQRAMFLLQAAKAGTEVARRSLVNATEEAYYSYSLVQAQTSSGEENLRSAEAFESSTRLLVEGGEVAPVDLMRAQLQTANRRDELEQSRVTESVAAENLRVYLGFDSQSRLAVSDLKTMIPEVGELGQFTISATSNRPELARIDAETEAAKQEAKIAKGERRPQLNYAVEGGFISNALRPQNIRNSAGSRVTVGVSIPLFDWGASKSRQRQAELRQRISETSRIFAERQLAAQFNSNLVQATSAASRIRTLAENLGNAERIRDTAILRYRAGETQIIEVTDAQTQIVVQRNALLQAIFDYRIAVARLKQATGR